MRTPTCANCKTKFPGDPCKKCGVSKDEATATKSAKMPSSTRRRRKHGRPR